MFVIVSSIKTNEKTNSSEAMNPEYQCMPCIDLDNVP